MSNCSSSSSAFHKSFVKQDKETAVLNFKQLLFQAPWVALIRMLICARMRNNDVIALWAAAPFWTEDTLKLEDSQPKREWTTLKYIVKILFKQNTGKIYLQVAYFSYIICSRSLLSMPGSVCKLAEGSSKFKRLSTISKISFKTWSVCRLGIAQKILKPVHGVECVRPKGS